MKKLTTGVLVAAVLAIAGGTSAQTAGPSVEPPPRGIVPVTGPSVTPTLPEAAKPGAVQGEAMQPAPRESPAGRTVSTSTQPAKGQKAAGATAAKTGGKKTTVKKTAAPKHVAKAAGPPKTKQVSTAKHQPSPARRATVGKPIPVAKQPPPAKGAAPAPPVLPRV